MADTLEEALVQKLTAALSPAAIYLFGSAAKGTLRDDSDIDVAVVLAERVPPVALYDLATSLGALLGRPVDLVDFTSAPETLQAEILRHGRLLARADRDVHATAVMRALSRYQRLNEERRPILDARLGKDGWKRLY